MKYFTINNLPFHCDDLYKWITVDKDRSVCLHSNAPSLHLELGFWDSPGCFCIQNTLDTSDLLWTQSCKELE